MATLLKKVFIDSPVFLAFIDRADSNHQKAVRVFENMAKFGYTAFTSLQNITETYALINREIGQTVALEFLETMLHSNIEIIFPQKSDLLTAQKIIKSNKDRQTTLKEALNATLMQRRNISQIVTFSYWQNLLGTNVSNLAS